MYGIHVSIWASRLELDSVLRTEVLINQGAPRFKAAFWKVPEYFALLLRMSNTSCPGPSCKMLHLIFWQANKGESLVTDSFLLLRLDYL